LNDAVFPNIERLEVEELGPEKAQWLAERIGYGNGRLFLVFDAEDVCEVCASFFL
jgi:hypothetical protein